MEYFHTALSILHHMKEKTHINLPQECSIRKILIIKWSALGDIVLATSAFEDIFRAFPKSEIHLNTLPQWKPLFEADPRFKKIIALPVKESRKQIYILVNWLKQIGSEQYDVIFDLQENDRSRLFLSFLWLMGRGARYRISGRGRFPYNVAPCLPRLPTHDFERLGRILQSVEIHSTTEKAILHLPTRSIKKVKAIQEEYNLIPLRYVVLIVGSHPRWITKRWGKERYVALAALFYQRGVSKIVLVGDEAEKEECEFIEKHTGSWVINLCKKLELSDIPILASQAKGIVSNDTGPAHLAAVGGRPLIVICGPTDPLRVKPIGQHVKTLQADLPCLNCYQPTCSHHSCMREITPEMVCQAFEGLVSLW